MAPLVVTRPSQTIVVPAALRDDSRPLYVCVAGLTGAGKTTALRAVADFTAGLRRSVVVIDEKALHHPYLDQLFAFPDRYAFELQVQFMVNRVLFAKRWLAAGHSLVVERSHLEDPIFIRHLLAFDHISHAEHDAYMELWTTLSARAPVPGALVYLDVPARVSIERLSNQGARDVRPPFPDDEAKRRWILSWHRLYRERFEELMAHPRHSSRIERFSSPVDLPRLERFLSKRLSE
jgi:deoxyadenosine/deoxycytidine kinase